MEEVVAGVELPEEVSPKHDDNHHKMRMMPMPRPIRAQPASSSDVADALAVGGLEGVGVARLAMISRSFALARLVASLRRSASVNVADWTCANFGDR